LSTCGPLVGRPWPATHTPGQEQNGFWRIFRTIDLDLESTAGANATMRGIICPLNRVGHAWPLVRAVRAVEQGPRGRRRPPPYLGIGTQTPPYCTSRTARGNTCYWRKEHATAAGWRGGQHSLQMAEDAPAAGGARRRRRNSSSFKRGVHGLDDVVGGSIARADVQFRGALEMVSGTDRGQPRRRQRYVLIGPETVEYFASESTMVRARPTPARAAPTSGRGGNLAQRQRRHTHTHCNRPARRSTLNV
jgi:hypothetical protein